MQPLCWLFIYYVLIHICRSVAVTVAHTQLPEHQLLVDAVQGNQLFVASHLHNTSIGDHDHLVRQDAGYSYVIEIIPFVTYLYITMFIRVSVGGDDNDTMLT